MVSQVCGRGRRLGLATPTKALAAVRGGPVGVSWLMIACWSPDKICVGNKALALAQVRGEGGGVGKAKLIVRLARRAPAQSNATPVSKALVAAKNMLPVSSTHLRPFTCDECQRARLFTAHIPINGGPYLTAFYVNSATHKSLAGLATLRSMLLRDPPRVGAERGCARPYRV